MTTKPPLVRPIMEARLPTITLNTAEFVHAHGQHSAHVHTADERKSHQQPIDNEIIYKDRHGAAHD